MAGKATKYSDYYNNNGAVTDATSTKSDSESQDSADDTKVIRKKALQRRLKMVSTKGM